MTAVTGAPSKMAANRDELTPMMTQYLELCEEYDDALVLFQVGDFYETFCEAAEETARLLEITLTQRSDSSGEYPMSGIPIENAASYVETLLDAGYRVAIADQVQDPDEASGVVDRAVTRVVTPGTVVSDELLDQGTSNYVACVARGGGSDDPAPGDRYGLAFVDVATGEFLATGHDAPAVIRDELDRFAPAEVLVGPGVEAGAFDLGSVRTDYDDAAFAPDAAADAVAAHVADGTEALDATAEVRACGALLAYAEYTQGGEDGALGYLGDLSRYDVREFVRLDETALRSLELFESRTAEDGETLFGVVDETRNALGRRELRHWLRRPLVDPDAIEARHDAVAELVESGVVRETLRDDLAEVYDVERLITRVSRSRANARDLRSLKATLDVVPRLREALADAESERLQTLRERLDPVEDVRGLIGDAVVTDPPQEITEGGVIREGFDADLDELRTTEREGREWVAKLEASERERTGIDSLKVGHNEVHGYYIEVTNPNLDSVPEDYTRRQTLKNAERFYTPELKEREDEILGAAERADSLEYDLFKQVRAEVGDAAERIDAVAAAVAELDALCALAHVAVEYGYTRPEMVPEGIEIEGGRHPVVERTQAEFVPNGVRLGSDRRVGVVTGPNMSGKSTYLRQTALIAILAQAGSFVPADAARLQVLDRVFTRVGASDDIAGGQSTFMREMVELTEILRAAGEDSLVVLDEVGRGTSTTDGLSIAWAVTEFLHDEIGAMTLFATHYHGLTEIADERPAVFNAHFGARRRDGEITFLHDVQSGPATSSYGVEVARMAGVPEPVVDRSHELLSRGGPTAVGEDDPEQGTLTEFAAGAAEAGATTADEPGGQAGNGDGSGADGNAGDVNAAHPTDDELAARLRELTIAEMTPIEALNALHDLKREVEGER